MVCYICGEEIHDEPFFYIGKRNGEKLFRHDDKEHEEIIINEFKRSNHLGEQVG